MSPLWRDRVTISLGPTRVHLARRARGWRPRVVMSHSVDCEPGEGAPSAGTSSTGAPWQAAVEALGRALGTLAWRDADAFVAVSNHFVRYALVPEAAKLRNDVERLAAARHRLHAVYGEHAEHWRIVLSTPGEDGVALAAAIEPELLAGIVATLTAVNLRPTRIEPLLVTAFNLCWRSMRTAPAWLAVAEPGRVCLAYVERGAWRGLRSERLRSPLAEALPELLERSRLADGIDGATGRVLLVAHEAPIPPIEFPTDGRWSLEPVALEERPAAASVRQ